MFKYISHMRSQVQNLHYLHCFIVCTLRQRLDNSIVNNSLSVLLLETGATQELLKVLNADLPIKREGGQKYSLCVCLSVRMSLCVYAHRFITKKAWRKLLKLVIQFIVLFVKNCQITHISLDPLTASTYSNRIIQLANSGTVLV